MDMQILDAGIINGFETLIKLCGYIVLFSIVCAFLQQLPFMTPRALLLATGTLEVTNAVAALAASSYGVPFQSVLAILFLSWGGLSGIAQSTSILQTAGLSVKTYVKQKCILFAVTLGCSLLLFFCGILG